MQKLSLNMWPEYPSVPLDFIVKLAWAALWQDKRSFHHDALRLTRSLPMKLLGTENIPHHGPGVVLVNHYHRPGFFAPWIALALSAIVPVDLVWTMTAAWTDANTYWERAKSMLSSHMFPRLAEVYSFIPMPPMPPRPNETYARARAVRQLLSAVRHQPSILLAVAPEGQDPAGSELMRPHPGVGRMLVQLENLGCRFHPAGVYEDKQELVLDFGPAFSIALSQGLPSGEIDHQAADMAMRAVSARLPEYLRGVYA